MKASYKVKRIIEKDIPWIKQRSLEEWGGEYCVFLGRKFYLEAFPAFYLKDAFHKRVGFITYEIKGQICEIMTLNAFIKFRGIGSRLLDRVIEESKSLALKKIIVRTTNDNLDALRFYQRKGFTISHFFPNALEADRKQKPAISMIGDYGIMRRDAIELEYNI